VDKNFCPYSDWAEALGKVYPLGSVKLSQSNNIIKILAKKFLPHAKEELILLPFSKKSGLKDKTQFNLKSLEPLKQNNEKSSQK
jgi:hypothetical protein